MRPDFVQTYMEMLLSLEKRSTCIRRSVACILTDSKNRVLSTGYNGVASGMPHCNFEEVHAKPMYGDSRYPFACSGHDMPSGQGLAECQAIHAEQNALLQCGDVDKIYFVYVSCSPCIHCVKLLMNTGAHWIYCREIYDANVVDLWESSRQGRRIILA